ncbi:hypothetical protein FYJ66_02530 [Clostridiales Family XIII bacterium RF-744-FAT-WT-3]|uniref:Uncharacterized protein n=1 Tax=Baileyella intestinalis TaxID=2606709 RepID=A0A6A8M7C7_9FIRM|nr:hypothetical protein [Baileyella intestinalis]MST68468.1 hypothetical protein [Baileyella intestinalis]
MATTKETMKIIAMGLGETGARETESCAGCPLVDALARRAAKHFTEMTEEMDEETVLEIVRKLETAACSDEPDAMITLLGRIFRQNGMESAAAEMEALSYCISEVPDACGVFADSFFDDGYVDWYCVEGWLRDMFPSKDQKLLS